MRRIKTAHTLFPISIVYDGSKHAKILVYIYCGECDFGVFRVFTDHSTQLDFDSCFEQMRVSSLLIFVISFKNL